MAERPTLTAAKRSIKGKKAKQLRNDGLIPGVIYGQGTNTLIQVENLPLRRVLRDAGMTNLIDINVGSQKSTVLAKDIQLHPTRGDLIHVDFYEVNMTEKIIVEAALNSVGIAPPQADGLGTVTLVLHAIEIECLPDNLISEIEVDFSSIQTPDDVILVSDLQVPEDVEILADPEATVARFEYLQEEVTEEEEEEDFLFAPSADEVEVIAKGKQEDEDEE